MPESLDDCFNVSEIPCTFVKKKNYNNNKDMELNRCGIVQWKECNKIINLWLDVLTHEAFLDLFPKGVPIRHLLFGSDTPGWETGREGRGPALCRVLILERMGQMYTAL